MQVEPGILRQSFLDACVLVGAVVVEDHVHLQPFWRLAVDGAQGTCRTRCYGAEVGSGRSPRR